MIDIRQTQEYANYLKKQGWIVERTGGINYFVRKLPLIGSFLKVQRPEEINYKIIKKLCRRYRVFQIILEPTLRIAVSFKYHNLLISHGFKLSKSPYLPTKTLQIDLTQPIDKITANFKKDVKYAIKRGESITIKKCSTLTDLKKFHEAWKKSVGWKRYVPPIKYLIALKKAFGQKSLFITAGLPAEALAKAGAIFLRTKDVAYYWQAFTNKEGRASLSQYSLVYQGILWAKKMGCKVFDFEGIYDERFPLKSWLGFTHFKKSFGGHEVEYPGCYTKFRFPY